MSDEGNPGEPRDKGEGPKQYHYFVDGQRYASGNAAMTGAQIKALIPNFNPAYQLLREGRADEPDQVVGDSDTVSLGPPPPMFYTVPPANFGR